LGRLIGMLSLLEKFRDPGHSFLHTPFWDGYHSILAALHALKTCQQIVLCLVVLRLSQEAASEKRPGIERSPMIRLLLLPPGKTFARRFFSFRELVFAKQDGSI